MPAFLARFGDTVVDGAPALKSGTLSLLSSIVQVGELLGSLTATVIGGVGGRRGGLMAACTFVSIGAIIQLACNGSVAQLTVGRLVLGMGIGQISNCAFPIRFSFQNRADIICTQASRYTSLSPPQLRSVVSSSAHGNCSSPSGKSSALASTRARTRSRTPLPLATASLSGSTSPFRLWSSYASGSSPRARDGLSQRGETRRRRPT